MATALRCPDCGYDQPPEQLSGTTFRCRRCGRLLAAPAPRPALRVEIEDLDDIEDGDPTVAVAPMDPEPAPPSHLRPLPWPVRAVVWLVALGVGLVAAVVPLRAMGWLSVDDALDAFAGAGLGRYSILLVLLPLWAAVSATLAHLVLGALARRRR